MVGSVIVANGKIIGEGWHQKNGTAHAEVNAINSVAEADKHLLKESTIYVSLEPCAHFGKTPPCANLIVETGIPNVVIACTDPFSKVNGKGIAILEKASVNVIHGVLENEGINLIKRFVTFHNKKRPYIILKWAESTDGFMGKSDEQVWLSNGLCKQLSHKWRTEEAVILVGENTVLTDNPNLTARAWQGKNPVRIAFQKHQLFPAKSNIFNLEADTILFTQLAEQKVPEQHNKVLISSEIDNFIPTVLNYLFEQNLTSLIVEGGKKVLQSFIEKNLWDEARIFKTDVILNAGIIAPNLKMQPTKSLKLDKHLLETYYNMGA
ncbi:UNVERIFIED_CONTAM: hypothetical protein GTU68_021291 [Idotea baltica]|nr:hypothetical protein [Idotea baltica]